MLTFFNETRYHLYLRSWKVVALRVQNPAFCLCQDLHTKSLLRAFILRPSQILAVQLAIKTFLTTLIAEHTSYDLDTADYTFHSAIPTGLATRTSFAIFQNGVNQRFIVTKETTGQETITATRTRACPPVRCRQPSRPVQGREDDAARSIACHVQTPNRAENSHKREDEHQFTQEYIGMCIEYATYRYRKLGRNMYRHG